MKKDTIGIYIHIPFCKSKCEYCDFNSDDNSFDKVDRYIGYLKKEIGLYKEPISKGQVDTIFIGGGTPTAIAPRHIEAILEEIFLLNRGEDNLEVTIEGNSEDYRAKNMESYLQMGINRFSMGVQSFDKERLSGIGRRLPNRDIAEIIDEMRMVGADNISVDIMFGLPGQTVKSSMEDIEQAISLGVEHISLYSLKLEEGTPLYEKETRGDLILPAEEKEREMYHSAIKILEKQAYRQYEISNFSLKNRESKHNLRYWRLKPYIGLGVSASSNIGGERYKNIDILDQYFESLDKNQKPIDMDSVEKIDRDMEIAEYTILGLRLREGILIKDFMDRFDLDPRKFYREVLEKHSKNGMLLVDRDRIKLTQKGVDLSNQLFCDLLPDES